MIDPAAALRFMASDFRLGRPMRSDRAIVREEDFGPNGYDPPHYYSSRGAAEESGYACATPGCRWEAVRWSSDAQYRRTRLCVYCAASLKRERAKLEELRGLRRESRESDKRLLKLVTRMMTSPRPCEACGATWQRRVAAGAWGRRCPSCAASKAERRRLRRRAAARPFVCRVCGRGFERRRPTGRRPVECSTCRPPRIEKRGPESEAA
jgi:predicted Zn-ribbon and HTH transcriptional regulator